ncbi:MAG: DivIVA domain-containing protein [Clostridiales bacterium]|nr:DivIVA domain-containing protein [Clostridiales bacterium]
MTYNIQFAEEKNGYSKEQVDGYVDKLSNAYEAAYRENQEVREQYKNLKDECDRLEVQEKTRLNAGVIAKTMLNLETMAQEIVAEAQQEVIEAKGEAKRLVDAAKAEAEMLKAAAEKIMDEANAEKAGARATAQRIKDEAATEAARIVRGARKGAEEANEIMKQALARLRDLPAYHEEEAEARLAG